MRKIFSLKYLLYICLIFCIIFLIFINLIYIIKGNSNKNIVPDYFGYKPYIVLTGSMEDTFKIGDLIIIKNIYPNEINNGDIIAFKINDIVVTHRVVDIVYEDDKYYFITKGDNNNVIDSEVVEESDILGIYSFKISGLGNIFMFLNSFIGKIFVILIIIIDILVIKFKIK